MLKLINSFIRGSGIILNELLVNLTEVVFYAEKSFTQSLGSPLDFNRVYETFFDFAISLIILKFLKKGFDIYITWFDGDKDSDSMQLLMNFARAIIVALSFRFLYGIMVDISTDFLNRILLSLVSLQEGENLVEALLTMINNNIFMGILSLVLAICYCILWLKFLVLGVEMFVMRLAFPIACIGLLDSDRGVFSPYMKKILMIMITAIIQVFLLRLSLILLLTHNVIWGFIVCLTAIKTPKSLQEFMFVYGGGGAIGGAVNTGYHVSRLAQMIRKVK